MTELQESTKRCIHCGYPLTLYGPETFHTETTLIRCANTEGTRATRSPKEAL